MPVDRARLALVAGFGPVVGADEEILGGAHLPVEIAAAVHLHQRPADIDGVIGAEAELATRLELGRDQIERAGVHHATLGVAEFGPWIGVEKIEPVERGIGQAPQRIERIAHVEADVG